MDGVPKKLALAKIYILICIDVNVKGLGSIGKQELSEQ